ncbi:hypothetical protein C1646_766187 [Rhizophagus diaphanus]|nr:hypothetical protein C1646_766187 [Rhizophagus diaphanus] [Rhizophagus sp. MUCL 43196]
MGEVRAHTQTDDVDKYYSGDFVTYRKSSGSPKEIGRILAIVQQDNGLKIKIQQGELWFLDREIDDATINIEPQAISRCVPITILYDDDVINRDSLKIQKILYKYNGHWKLRDVKYSYRHPSKFAAFEELTTELPVYKLYIDLYYDDFRTF